MHQFYIKEDPQKKAKRQIQMCREHLKYDIEMTKITNIHTSERFSQKICHAFVEEPNDESGVSGVKTS